MFENMQSLKHQLQDLYNGLLRQTYQQNDCLKTSLISSEVECKRLDPVTYL